MENNIQEDSSQKITLIEKHDIYSGFLKALLFISYFFIMGIPDIPLVFGLNDYITLAIHIVLFLLLAYFLISKYRKHLSIYNPNGFGKTKLNGKLVLFMISMFFTDFAMHIAINMFQDSVPSNEIQLQNLSLGLPITMLFSIIIVAPIVEELLFRGIFFNYFFNQKTLLNNILAVFFSGLLFGLMHEPRISLHLLTYSLMGWIFATIYMFTKDIRYSIFYHGLNNFLASIPLILSIIQGL